ncbi:Membrane transporter [Colletotrichum higginsianum IMI 349063]|uniref:Membrane transporter n=3 Tax=Colletotrichum higginsianum TaxID=80884 RepID=A0A1B7Y8G6_COLHI|nr:Membrane transporter [Colletotrichum higginsianum IMI 349063]OBR08215.1 Membrane transporter [Colletotrichum higginsianum IMI 349063]TIC89551.1 putative transporter C5D6.04 [Colletotrichum higginsianum]
MDQQYMTPPTSFRLADMAQGAYDMPLMAMKKPHDSHPSMGNLVLLVFEAVLEVVCVSLPGYIVARMGHFDADKQKFLANLNVMLFTPCLIFTKLASQLNADKLLDLAVIPIIFVIQTLVSWLVSVGVSRLFGFNRRASNFVTAMGVFGNSNSLPISMILSLSQTIKGLHWDKIPGDNDDEVGARGILYLLIFQQLGQLVRWSWGYHVLLAPKDKYPEYQDERIEEGQYAGDRETAPLLNEYDDGAAASRRSSSDNLSNYEPAGRTPVASRSRASPADTEDEDEDDFPKKARTTNALAPLNGNHPVFDGSGDEISSFPRILNTDEPDVPEGVKGYPARVNNAVVSAKRSTSNFVKRQYEHLPAPAKSILSALGRFAGKLYNFLWEFMNPPLWAMLIAVVVASIPALQKIFFEEGSFVKNSFTDAVQSSAGVAVPLILVVLGANLARNTQKSDKQRDPEEDQIGTKLLVASLVCRMLLPTLIMTPILAIFAKYVPVSILDDPIFVIVCFLLTGAPSALQLAQICQINEVYEGVMSRILFQSYVIWILPSTLILVMCALEVVEWAA